MLLASERKNQYELGTLSSMFTFGWKNSSMYVQALSWNTYLSRELVKKDSAMWLVQILRVFTYRY